MRLPREFRRAFRKGRRFGTAFLRIHFVPNDRPYSRLGLVVRRKLGKAVTRNRLKRRLREVFRKHKYELDTPLDIVLVAELEIRPYDDYQEAFHDFIDVAHRQTSRGIHR